MVAMPREIDTHDLAHVEKRLAMARDSIACKALVESERAVHDPRPGEHDGLPALSLVDESINDPGPYCSHCSDVEDADGYPVDWPCDVAEFLETIIKDGYVGRVVDGWDYGVPED